MRSIVRLLLISLLGIAVAGSDVGTLAADTFTVTSVIDDADANPGDRVCETAPGNQVCTLRAAVQETNATINSDTPDVIILPAGTYSLTRPVWDEDDAVGGDLDIKDSLMLVGAGATQTIVSGDETDRVFEVIQYVTGMHVTITGVQIQHGNTPYLNQQDGGGIRNESTLTLNDTIITNNRGGSGGGIYSRGRLTIERSIIENNVTRFSGGGIFTAADAPATITASTIRDNAASQGGGIAASGPLILRDSTVNGNQAHYQGGGLETSSDASIMAGLPQLAAVPRVARGSRR